MPARKRQGNNPKRRVASAGAIRPEIRGNLDMAKYKGLNFMEGLEINLTPEPIDAGPDYEKAAYGLLVIKVGDRILTSCVSNDSEGRHYHDGPYVSGYHLAEWLVWNWWRLRWEPCPDNGLADAPPDWRMAHSIAAIGEGYVWPKITFSSDGLRCIVTSERSTENNGSRLYYTGAPAITILSGEFENALDRFVNSILHLIENASVGDSNLQILWNDLTIERKDPEIARFRRFEALLGLEPDEFDEAQIENWRKDAKLLRENAPH